MSADQPFSLRPYQREAVDAANAMLERWRSPLLVLATGCHRAGQGVLMYDGSVKRVECVAVGDQIAGPDGPRTVLALARGAGEMVEIVPVKGDSWVVNLDHVLTLVRTAKMRKPLFPSQAGGVLVDVTVREWLGWSKGKKHLHKLLRAAVDFAPRPAPTVDPYLAGALLGDGSACGIVLTTPDREIWGAVEAAAEKWGLAATVSYPAERCESIRATAPRSGGAPNPLLNEMRRLGVTVPCGEKSIHESLRCGSRETRLQVLAGLMDTDGHMSGGGFDYISKSERLSRDLVFVARSVGLAAYVSECEKFCQTGGGGTYWRVSISGDCSIIPTRVPRKQAPPRRQKKDVLRAGFAVRRLGIEPYFGFELDGDGRFLLDDFTITHNTGKTTIGATVVGDNLPRGRALWLAHRTELLEQACERMKSMGLDARIEQGRRKAGDAAVVVATTQTMVRRLGDQGFALVVLDEAQHGAGASNRKILDHYGVPWLGLTATPGRADGAALGHDGVAYSYTIRDAVRDNVLVRPVGQRVRCALRPEVLRTSGGDYTDASAALCIQPGLPEWCAGVAGQIGERQTIAFLPDVATTHAAAEVWRAMGLRAEGVDGKTSDAERARIIAAYRAGDLQILVNCLIFTEGFDAPETSAVAICRPTKNAGLYQQMAGRGLRLAPGKTDCLILDLVGVDCDLISETAASAYGETSAKATATDGPVDIIAAIDAAEAEAAARARYVAEIEEIDLLARRGAKRKAAPVKPEQLGIVYEADAALPTIADARRIMAAGIAPPMCAAEAEAVLAWLAGRDGLCSAKQARMLRRYGLPEDATREQAAKVAELLVAQGWRNTPQVRALALRAMEGEG